MTHKYVISIEDSEDDLLLMRRIFDKQIENCELRNIKDGEAAIQVFGSEGFINDLPALIMLDIKLPKRNGLEVLEFLRAQPEFDEVPVLMLSSSDRLDEITKAYDLGVNSFIEKPKSYPELRERLPRIVKYWLNFNIKNYDRR
ncbi:MAG: response regulator [Leeuwenhoekiella sp.]